MTSRHTKANPSESINALLFILNFHGIGKPPRQLAPGEQKCWVEEPLFEAILDSVRGRRDVQITFDDANESDYSIALPALRAREMVAAFFIVTHRIDTTHYLSTSQVQMLASAGMTIGNHGMHHRPWSNLSGQHLREELIEARASLEQIAGIRVTDAACPFGSYNRRVLRALRSFGYQKVYTSDEGPALVGSWLQPRNTVLRGHDMSQLSRLINIPPGRWQKAWRNLKLTFKRLR